MTRESLKLAHQLCTKAIKGDAFKDKWPMIHCALRQEAYIKFHTYV